MTSPTPTETAWKLPSTWSKGARDAFQNVIDVRPDLNGAELASLEQAALLITAADRQGRIARAAGYVVEGSRNGPSLVSHPAATEERMSRQAAATILARLVVVGNGRRPGRLRSEANLNRDGRARL